MRVRVNLKVPFGLVVQLIRLLFSGLPRIGPWYIIMAIVGPSYRHDTPGRVPENNRTIQTVLSKEALRSPPDMVMESVQERTTLDLDLS